MCFQYYRRYEDISSDFDNFGFILQNWNLNECFNISGNINSTKKEDHILEMPELGEFFLLLNQESYMLKKVDDWMSQINSKIKEDF